MWAWLAFVSLFAVDPFVARAQEGPLTELRWARGTVAAVTPTTLTLKMLDRDLVIARGPATEVVGHDALPAGIPVEVHYTDRDDVRTAMVIFAGTAAGAGGASKRPGRSVLGVYVRARNGALSMRHNKRTREFQVEQRSRLVDRQGQELAKGFKPLPTMITAGDRLLVKYDGSIDISGAGDSPVYSTSDNVLEIRQMPGAPD